MKLYLEGTVSTAPNPHLTSYGDSYLSYDSTNNQIDFVVDNQTEIRVLNSSASSDISLWVNKNVSATGYITRTTTYDKSKGSALEKIKDASELRDENGKVKHEEFYGYVQYEVPDYSRPVIVNYTDVDIIYEPIDKLPKGSINKTNVKEGLDYISIEAEGKETREFIQIPQGLFEMKMGEIEKQKVTYPYKIIEEGVNVGDEIELLRQATYEQNQIINRKNVV